MTLTIWVDDWQIQCCGKAFAPGDVVSWNLLEADPEDYVDVVGNECAAGIGFREEHHGQEGDHAPELLEVLTITEVHRRYAVPPGSTTTIQGPVPGSTELVPANEANGWAESRQGTSFAGYLVTARPAHDPQMRRPLSETSSQGPADSLSRVTVDSRSRYGG